MAAVRNPLAVSDSVSSRVSRALRKAASARLSAFTLAELIVVIAIVAVLATIAFLALSGYTEDARDARAKANVRTVHSAISAESALTGNSPRYYVAHDADYALSGAYLYVDGTPVALTGGNVGEAPLDSNYTAGQPRWDRLKLDAEKFRVSGISADSRLAAAFAPLLPEAFAAFDKTALSAGAADVPTVSAAGKVRTVSFLQIAGILPDTGAVAVSGDFPAPSAADLAASESNGKPAAAGLVRNPDAGPAEALADSSTVSAPAGASCGSAVHGAAKTFWTAESVPHGQTCPAGVEFSCDNGSWVHESADKASYPSEVACVVWTPADCSAATVDGYSLSATNHGDAVVGTKPDASFLNGTKNLSQNFLCSNGSFAADGAETGTIASCNEGYESNGTSCLPKSCDLPWGGTLAHGDSAPAFQTATATYPATCAQETRTCSLGVLSGSFTNVSCAYQYTCPSGFVPVPDSSAVSVGGTSATNGWCVAKYEMSPNSSASWTQDTTYLGWRYDSASKPDPKVVSKPGSYPITYVTRNEAETACSTQLADQSGAALTNGHLLSVALWKKIADDVAAQSSNWSGTGPGNGNMSRGHASGTPNTTLQGAASDTVAKPAAGNFYDRRNWALSNGSVIHDFAGNVWEWYYDLHGSSCSAWAEHTSGTFSYNGVSLEPATSTWASAQGVGQICTTSATVPTTATYSAVFGGHWDRAAYAGVFTSTWNTYSPSATRVGHVGFRCIVPAR